MNQGRLHVKVKQLTPCDVSEQSLFYAYIFSILQNKCNKLTVNV